METKELMNRFDKLERLFIISNKKLLTFEEACIYLDYSPNYLYKLTSQKKIPHCKPLGKAIFFSTVQLEAWVLKSTINTNDYLPEIATR